MNSKFIAVFLVTCVTFAVRADTWTDPETGITWNYYVNGETAMIGGKDYNSAAISTSTIGAVAIPSMLDGKRLTSIEGGAFYRCERLTNVTIPDGVTEIGCQAFSGCSSLTNVTIPSGVTYIADSTFDGCISLTSVTIPAGVTQIGYKAFSGCSSLINVTIPSGVTYIAENTFYGCSSLTSVTIPDGVTEIGDRAFSGCDSLTSVTIPQYVSNRSLLSVFPSSYQIITNVVVLGGVTDIGSSAFVGCTDLESVTIPDSVTKIGDHAFDGCEKLVSVAIPNSVTYIGDYAFRACRNLETLEIPRSVLHIGHGALGLCGKLLVQVNEENENYKSFRGMVLSKDGKVLLRGENGDIEFPETVTTIDDYAFAGCSDFTNLLIPVGVTNIGEYAFAYCDSLTAVEIPNSVKYVGVGAFAYCNNLKSAIIPQCICAMASTDMGIQNTYSGVIKTSGGVSCVFGCESMTRSSGGSYYGTIEECPCNPALTNIVVAWGTTYITDFAFADCKNLLSVAIPSSVTRMGYGVFKDCTSLVSLSFEGDAPDVGSESSSYSVDTPVLFGTPRRLKVKVREGSIGWSGGGEAALPSSWCDRAIVYTEDAGGSSGGGNGPGGSGSGGTSAAATAVSLTVTNVVVHYVLNSVVPEVAMPISDDTGFVTVVTEIKGGAVAIPESWAANYSGFVDKFGNDFTAALTKPSGKRDAQGNAMMVWQDYVAGTDPTKIDDVFHASITIVDGVPQIGYTPELPPEERAKRNYVTYGKARLQDEEWHVVDGDAANYNFFKVTVEMK